jgi:hypothetical protein
MFFQFRRVFNLLIKFTIFGKTNISRESSFGMVADSLVIRANSQLLRREIEVEIFMLFFKDRCTVAVFFIDNGFIGFGRELFDLLFSHGDNFKMILFENSFEFLN